MDIHKQLETKLAEFKNTEAAVTFSSGYATNISVISALVGRKDTVICDKLDHASLVDGCLLSGANFVRHRHGDMGHLEECLKNASESKRVLVVSDGVFSMDGDILNLPEVSRLCKQYGALFMVDEAHSLGALGATGKGIEEHFGLPPDAIDIKMGTLSKAIPSNGGYVAASHKICHYLAYQSRGYIYSGALSPIASAVALASLEVMEDELQHIRRLHENTRHFANGLREAGFSFRDSQTSIFPVIIGEDWDAWRVAKACQDRGVFVQAIPYPVLPKGSARLRMSVNASHQIEDLDFCISVLKESMAEVGIAH